jgi:hypothetical protein
LFRAALKRVTGVIRRPRATLADVATTPRWAVFLVAITLAAAAASAALMSTEVGRQALVDQWERTALAFGQAVDDTRYAQFQAMSARGPVYGVLSALLNVPVMVGAAAVLMHVAFGRGGAGVPFAAALAVAAHTGVILALRLIVGAPVAYVRETTASATSLGVWFPALDEAAPLARLLGLLDLFALWWLVTLAIGVSVLYRRRAGPVAAWFIGIYAGLAAMLALAMAAFGGTS